MHRFLVSILAVALSATLPTANARADGFAVPKLGLVGVAAGQTARISLLNVPLPLIPTDPCHGIAQFFDAQGNLLQQAPVTIGPNQSFSLDQETLADGPAVSEDGAPALRAAFIPTGHAGNCSGVVSTFEVFDSATGGSALLYPPTTITPPETKTPRPFTFVFGLTGLGPGEAARLNLVNLANPAIPTDPCHVVVTFVDANNDVLGDVVHFTIAAGQTSTALQAGPGSDLIGTASGAALRVPVAPVLTLDQGASATACRSVTASFEIFDPVAGRTLVVNAGSPLGDD